MVKTRSTEGKGNSSSSSSSSINTKERHDNKEGTFPSVVHIHGRNDSTKEVEVQLKKDAAGGKESTDEVNDVPLSSAPYRVLVEIVSALHLPSTDRFSEADPYVIVYLGRGDEQREIHRTKVLYNKPNPVWTVENGSLFLLELSREDSLEQGIRTSISDDPSTVVTFVVKEYDTIGKGCTLGRVSITLKELLKGEGKRKEYVLVSPGKTAEKSVRRMSSRGRKLPSREATLVLRYKKASEEDIMFMKTLSESNAGMFSHEAFLPPSPSKKEFPLQKQHLFGHHHHHHHHHHHSWGGKLFKHDNKHHVMSEQEYADHLLVEAVKPSEEWIDVGAGNHGKLYLEIIGCDDLINLDAGTSLLRRNMNDTFCCMVLEDSVVNTSIISDTLSPRWRPDDQRAFIFHLQHPSSQLLIGVMDYDKVLSASNTLTGRRSIHDPVGRVGINLTQFYPNTVYTLAYHLYEADLDAIIARETQTSRGKLIIRLRIEWGDKCCVANETKNMLLAGIIPSRSFYISVPHKENFQTAYYTTNAEHRAQAYSTKTLTAYVEELQDYVDEDVIGLILDATSTVLLWRGHWRIKVWCCSINMPLHSMTAFIWGILVTQDYNRFPAFLAFSIGWFFLATMEYRRNHPSPWHRCKSYGYLLWTLVAAPFCCCSGPCSTTASIAANENLPAIEAYVAEVQRMKKMKEERKKRAAEQAAELEEESGGMGGDATAEGDIKIATEKKDNFVSNLNPLKPILYPLQQILAIVCKYVRIVKGIITWDENYYAFWITTACFVSSLIMFFIPWGWILRWAIRLAVWTVLGPWMKIVDWIYFERLDHMTEEQRKKMLRDSLYAKYEHNIAQQRYFQERRERAVKLKSMMRYLFGKYVLRVPRFRETRFQDFPLPESMAEPYEEPPEDYTVVGQVCGQTLAGDMVPKRMLPDHPVVAELEAREEAEGRLFDKSDIESMSSEKHPLLVKIARSRKKGRKKMKKIFGVFKKK